MFHFFEYYFKNMTIEKFFGEHYIYNKDFYKRINKTSKNKK